MPWFLARPNAIPAHSIQQFIPTHLVEARQAIVAIERIDEVPHEPETYLPQNLLRLGRFGFGTVSRIEKNGFAAWFSALRAHGQ